jgi:hypothetical protein
LLIHRPAVTHTRSVSPVSRYVVEKVVSDPVDGFLSRREAIRRLGLFGLTAAAASTLIVACGKRASAGAAYDPWWDAVIAPPADIPAITSATSSQINGGTTITPTADYNYDPYFRYDGCHTILSDAGGIYATLPEVVVPEIVTDAQDVEAVFRGGRDGTSVIGVRVVVDGKLSHLKMLRFDGVKGTDYYYKHHFPSAKVRHLKFEVDGGNRFKSAVVGAHTIIKRPEGAHRFRHTAIGDSLQKGGADYHIGAEVFGDLFYMCWESHSRFQAALMGCDSYVSLGAGGTGWSDNVPDDPFSARIATALAGFPHVLGFYGSRNDAGKEGQVTSAVTAALDQVEDVPVVLVSGPQQAGFTRLNTLVQQGVAPTGRTWLDLNGVAAAPASNSTHHPTFEDQLKLARAAHAQIDMARIRAAVDRANASRPNIVLTTSPVSPIVGGAYVTLTAAITTSPDSPAVSGAVQFYDNGVALASPIIVGPGNTSITTSALSIDTHTLTAEFLPAISGLVKSTSAPVTLVVSANLGVVDSFNRTDGPVGKSEDGKPWNTGTYPGWVISGNSLSNPTAAAPVFCDVDLGIAYGVYEFTLAGTYSAVPRLMLFYASDADNVFLNGAGGANNWRLWTRIDNTASAIATARTEAGWTAGDVIRIEVTHGTSSTKANFVVKKNGTTMIAANDVELGILADNTKLAFYVDAASNSATLDAVTMTPAT